MYVYTNIYVRFLVSNCKYDVWLCTDKALENVALACECHSEPNPSKNDVSASFFSA